MIIEHIRLDLAPSHASAMAGALAAAVDALMAGGHSFYPLPATTREYYPRPNPPGISLEQNTAFMLIGIPWQLKSTVMQPWKSMKNHCFRRLTVMVTSADGGITSRSIMLNEHITLPTTKKAYHFSFLSFALESKQTFR
ncbi:hypothetical protein D8B26_006993 [Coccidioides posadasii str. Silveira]|uniref:uncharacterized protein n=1 Tax=Coccidioides posadasii (strain RMSCC 757 / Silveira) TaxID=443226 RepID=UPI001BED616D|nr:hypothetical protein D8B26_006993 [Coccidioides posadasii str. Silveira]